MITELWDFSKLPDSEKEKVDSMIDNVDVDGLVKIHNKYKLSTNNYCCSPGVAIIGWFEHGRDNNYI